MDVFDYLSNLPDEFMVAVNYNTIDGVVIKQNGLAVNTDPPSLEIRFGPNARLEPDQIDLASDCLVFIETGDIVTLICTIEGNSEKNILRLNVRNLIQQVEKREYFRSPARRLAVTGSWKNKPAGSNNTFKVKSLNISSGGMLLITDQPVYKKDRIVFEIRLPEPVTKSIKGDATVLRVERQGSAKFLVAVMFENADEICDDIMKYCFAEQRRLLREKVFTKDML